MASATTLIKDALQDLGVLSAGQEPGANDLTDGRRKLNNMLASWSTSSILVPYRTQVSHVLDGSESYTIGSGGDINTTRPLKIVSAYTTHQVRDYPIHVCRDRAEYDSIYQKDITGIPRILYYEPEVPLGKIFIWYVGDASYTLFMNTQGQLASFSDDTTDVDLAPGYDLAIASNLAIVLAPMNETEISAELAKTAKDSLAQIKRLNRQEPVMNYDDAIPGGRGQYNIEAGW